MSVLTFIQAIDTLTVFLKDFFEQDNFESSQQDDNKSIKITQPAKNQNRYELQSVKTSLNDI